MRDVCELRGLAETEAEVPPAHAKRFDLWFVPDAGKLETAPEFTDILAEMTAEPSAIELWSGGLSDDQFHATFAKRENFRQRLAQRGKRPRLRPMLWHVCARRPKKLIAAFGFVSTNMPGWYVQQHKGWRVQIVVVEELPKTRSTVLLRLLGRGRVRREALEELRQLPGDAWEKNVAYTWILTVGWEVRVNKSMSARDRELVMDARAFYKEHMAEHERKVARKVTRKVEARVLRQVEAERAEERQKFDAERRRLEAELADAQRQAEVKQIVHLFEHRVGRPLNVDERNALATCVKQHGSEYLMSLALDLSGPDLAAWLEKNGVARSD